MRPPPARSRRRLAFGRKRRLWRAAAGAIAAAAFSLVGVPGASADNATVEPSAFNWFWSSNVGVTTCEDLPDPSPLDPCGPISGTGGFFGNASGATSPISTGHLAVAMREGSSDMRGYVKFPLSAVPFGATIDSFVVTLLVSSPEDREHTQTHVDRGLDVPATANQQGAAIVACAVAEPWASAQGGDGGDPPYSTQIDRTQITPENPDPGDAITQIKNEPDVDCGFQVSGSRSNDARFWSFDITRMAQAWATRQLFNEGIALRPEAAGVNPTWTVEFHGMFTTRTVEEDRITLVTHQEAAKAAIEYTPGSFVPPPQPPAPPPPPIFPGFPPPAPIAPPPVVPPPPAPPVLVGTAEGKGPGKLPAAIWALVPLGLLGFGLVSSAISEDAGRGAGNRVASLLRARRLAGGAEGVADTTEAS